MVAPCPGVMPPPGNPENLLRSPDLSHSPADILYQVPDGEGARVSLKVFDVSGSLVRVLVDENQLKGTYRVKWDGRDGWGQVVPAGVYFYQLRIGGEIVTDKTTVLR